MDRPHHASTGRGRGRAAPCWRLGSEDAMQRGDFAQLGAGSRCRGRTCSFFITGNTTACSGPGRASMAPAARTGRRPASGRADAVRLVTGAAHLLIQDSNTNLMLHLLFSPTMSSSKLFNAADLSRRGWTRPPRRSCLQLTISSSMPVPDRRATYVPMAPFRVRARRGGRR